MNVYMMIYKIRGGKEKRMKTIEVEEKQKADYQHNIGLQIKLVRNRYLCILDMIFIFVSYMISAMMIHNIYDAAQLVAGNIAAVLFTVLSFLVVLYASGVYTTMWIYSGTKDYIRIACACVLASAISVLINAVFFPSFYFKLSICAVFLVSVEVITFRMAIRGVHNLYNARSNSSTDKKRLLIVGAGAAAAIMLRDITNNENLNYEVVGFVDDDENKKNARINGYKVLGTRNDIPKICLGYDVDEILIAMPSASAVERKKIIEICNETKGKIKILPSIDQIIDQTKMYNSIRNVQIEDLLAREPIRLDNSGIRGYIENKTILVTGGGGSIGSELCRQIMRFSPKKLVILDIYENNAYDIQMELNRKYPNNKPEVVIASVRDIERIDDIFKLYKPYIVFHAAAHKHVPLMEDSPGEAVKNNVFGTLNVVKCADKYGVKRFVMISTDKAVNPTNIMGATKRICEMIVQCMQKESKTEFVAVRFGNVLGSNGSVIPLFKRQIEEGGPITVTDKRITRFFMTIPEAAQLVLQAASYAKGGEIFVLDMGDPVKIYDLAKNLIRLSGYKPDEDIKIEVCGLRPGEKLYEELLMNEEGLTNTSHNKIFIGKPIDIDQKKLDIMLNKLEKAAESDDPEIIKSAVEQVVPTYVRNNANSDIETYLD